jgi:hypothetical protein
MYYKMNNELNVTKKQQKNIIRKIQKKWAHNCLIILHYNLEQVDDNEITLKKFNLYSQMYISAYSNIYKSSIISISIAVHISNECSSFIDVVS